jgi:hypothetical protein
MARAAGKGVIPVEITQAPWHYTTFWDWLDHWQSLAAGLVAVVAAIIAVVGAEVFAQRKERREIEGIRVAFAVEARGLMDTMIATHGALVDMLNIHETSAIRSVGLVPAAELERARAAEKAVRSIGRSLARLRMPVVYPACADRIGTLGRRLAEDVARFYANYEHLQFLGGVVFQDASTTLELAQYAAAFEDVCLKALPLFEGLPIEGMREPLDLDGLKAKVEGMAKAREASASVLRG